MKKYYILLLIMNVSFAHAMQDYSNERAIMLTNFSTKIQSEGLSNPVYNLLLYPSEIFKKTDIFYIIDLTKDTDEQSIIQAERRGTVASITAEMIEDIAAGYALYHYGIKSSKKNSSCMDIGAFAIDKNLRNYDSERNAICLAALKLELLKTKNKKKQGHSINFENLSSDDELTHTNEKHDTAKLIDSLKKFDDGDDKQSPHKKEEKGDEKK